MPFIVTQKKHQIEIITMKNYEKKNTKLGSKRETDLRENHDLSQILWADTHVVIISITVQKWIIRFSTHSMILYSFPSQKIVVFFDFHQRAKMFILNRCLECFFIQFKFLLYISIEYDHFCHTNFDHFLDFVLQ